jgi:hypothetical protein
MFGFKLAAVPVKPFAVLILKQRSGLSPLIFFKEAIWQLVQLSGLTIQKAMGLLLLMMAAKICLRISPRST